MWTVSTRARVRSARLWKSFRGEASRLEPCRPYGLEDCKHCSSGWLAVNQINRWSRVWGSGVTILFRADQRTVWGPDADK